jgi:hypothetical protein
MHQKLDAVGKLYFFVGNSPTQKGDRYWDPSTGKVNKSRDVSPIEHRYEPRIPAINVQNEIDVFSTCEKYGEQQPVDDEPPDSPDEQQPMELGNHALLSDEAEDNRSNAEEEVQLIVPLAVIEPTVEPPVLLPLQSQR